MREKDPMYENKNVRQDDQRKAKGKRVFGGKQNWQDSNESPSQNISTQQNSENKGKKESMQAKQTTLKAIWHNMLTKNEKYNVDLADKLPKNNLKSNKNGSEPANNALSQINKDGQNYKSKNKNKSHLKHKLETSTNADKNYYNNTAPNVKTVGQNDRKRIRLCKTDGKPSPEGDKQTLFTTMFKPSPSLLGPADQKESGFSDNL